MVKSSKMRDSMSRADNCYDNAFMESGIGTIKNELEMTEYKSIREAVKEISPYVRYYNFERKHSAIEYVTSTQFEQLIQRSKQENELSPKLDKPQMLCLPDTGG